MTPMTLGRTEQPIQEIVGIYTNNEEIDIALSDLRDAGFGPSQTGLIANKNAVRNELSAIYTEVPASSLSPAVQMDFVGKRTNHSQLASHLGGLGSLGAPASNNVVVSRSILVGAAKAATSREVEQFPTGVAVLDRMPAMVQEEVNLAKSLVNALEDDRFLLCVS